MIKQITNLNGIKIETNRIVEGSGTRYVNQAINTLNNGEKMLYKFHNISFSNVKRIGNARFLIPVLGSGTFEIAIYRNTQIYVPSLVHGNNDPAYDTSTYVHYEKITLGQSGYGLESRLIEVDLTSLFNRWLEESAVNLSITLKYTSSTSLTIFGPNHDDVSDIPLLDIRYAEIDTYSPSFDYVQDELDFGGNSYVNTLTGKLAHQFDVFETNSKKFPIKFSVNYIERLTGITMNNSLVGNWRTNFDYGFDIKEDKITIVSPEGAVSYYEIVSRDEATKLGITTEPNKSCFVNYIDNSYILEKNKSGSIQRYELHDLSKNVIEFNSNKLIMKIIKEDKEYIEFSYNSNNQVTTIESKDGYIVTLTYSNNRIEYVNFIKENRRLKILYSGNGISDVILQKLSREITYNGTTTTYPEIMRTIFMHDGSKLVQVVNNKTLEGIKFEYNNEKVIKIINIIKDGNNYLNNTYREINYKQNYTKVTNNEGNEIYLTHDTYGMLHQTIDKYGNSFSLKHDFIGTNDLSRKMTDDSGIIPSVKNKLIDGSFELLEIEGMTGSNLGWKTNNFNDVKQVQDGVYGKNTLLIEKNTENTTQVYQTVKMGNGTHKLEFFVKTKNISGNASVIVKTSYERSVSGTSSVPTIKLESKTYKSAKIDSSYSKWTKIVIDGIYLADMNSNGTVKIIIDGSHQSGELMVDSMKFTSEKNISNGNLIIGGDLEDSILYKFDKVNCDTNDKVINESEILPYSLLLGTKKFRFNSAKNIVKHIERIIPLSGASGESLTFSFWGKSDFNSSSSLKGRVVLLKENEIVQTVEVSALKEIPNWQLLAVSLQTKRTYDAVKLIIEYTGVNKCLIDNISLFKDDFGTHYSYNEKGSLLEEADNVSSSSFKNDGSKIVESNDKSGEKYNYVYNDEGKVIKVIDHKGNVIDLEYTNGNRTKSKITSDGKILELHSEYNSDDQVVSMTDELNNKTKFTYDNDKRLKTKTEANGLITTNSYDEFNNLVSLVKSKSGTLLSSSYEYYPNNLLKKIIADNGTTYEFIYDKYAKVKEIKLNSETFVKYEYGVIKNGVITDNITKQTIGQDVYEFLYDSKLRLKEIFFNDNLIVEYEYDSNSNVSKKTYNNIVDEENNKTSNYLDYDNKGKVLRETRDNGDSINYDYDNLEQLQKLNIDINGMKRSYDYEYLNEYNEYSKENIINRIDKAFNDDIIDYNSLNSGMYGARALSAWGSKVTYEDKKLFRLNKMTSKIIYPLETINERRKTGAYGGRFNLDSWKNQFKDNKSIFGWFRFTGDIGTKHKIFAFGNDTTDQYYVTISKTGTNFLFELFAGGNDSVKTLTTKKTDKLIFIGLSLSRGSTGKTKYNFTVNDNSGHGDITTNSYVANLTKFVLGNRNITTGSMIENPFLQDVALISIGAYKYDVDVFRNILSQQNKFNSLDLKPKTGVSFINQNVYENFEVISLNGTFKSTEGRAPSEYEYVDGTFKIDKTKLFKYDETLERHVYGSYSVAQGFGISKGLLSYNHNLKNKGVIALNFKLEGSISENRTLFEFGDEENSKLKVFINKSKKIELRINDIPHKTELVVLTNQWNRLLLSFSNDGKVKVYLNKFSDFHEEDIQINVKDTKLYIGSTMTPDNHLEGVIEMLAFKNTLFEDETAEVTNILEGSQQLSVKTEIDVMGRSKKDIIDTGILKENKETTKKLISSYSYKEEPDNKTSLQVSNINGFDGYNKEYKYDEVGNITSIKVTGEGIVGLMEYKYTYDALSRLIEENNPFLNQTIKYTYTLNNNIKTAKHYSNKTNELVKTETYEYDETYKDKLESITTLENGNETLNEIEYDINHNPTEFLGENVIWEGRRLKNIGNSSFEYNESGIRTSKTVDNVTTNYHLLGDNVISLKRNNDKLFFHYNERDMLVGFEYNKENFFYSRDLTGVINNIVDKNGNVVVKYEYDVWGNLLNKDQAAKLPIGETLLELNPFIYKGYIYDFETNLYYLKSRYYSPKIRRFISPDSLIGDVGNIYSYNLFAYSNNNPVNLVDEDGNMPRWLRTTIVVTVSAIAVGAVVAGTLISGGTLGPVIVGAIIGSGVSGGVSFASQLITTGTVDPQKLLVDFAMGAVAGALGFSSFGSLVMPIFGGAIGFSSSIASDWVDETKIDFKKAVFAGVLGFTLAMGNGIQHFSQKPIKLTFNKVFKEASTDLLSEIFQEIIEFILF